jgi:hypothetical protein
MSWHYTKLYWKIVETLSNDDVVDDEDKHILIMYLLLD